MPLSLVTGDDLAALQSHADSAIADLAAKLADMQARYEAGMADLQAKLAALQPAPVSSPSPSPSPSPAPAPSPSPAPTQTPPADTATPVVTPPATVSPAPVLVAPIGRVSLAQSGYAAVVTIGGNSYVYNQIEGSDEGDYVGAFVSQNSVRIERDDCPIRVYVRRDTGGDHQKPVEFVLENGWSSLPTGAVAGSRAAAAAHTGPYHVDFYKDGQKIGQDDAADHWWDARWRWPRDPRPVVRSKADLDAMGAILWYDKAGASYAKATPGTAWAPYAKPMDLAGITAAIPVGGERNDLGVVTEIQAMWLINQDADHLSGLLAQAEGAGTLPFAIRDEQTGAAVDVNAYPMVNVFGNAKPFIAGTPKYVPATADPSPFRYSLSDVGGILEHMPDFSYLAYLLTDDQYYLENLQFGANYLIIASANNRVKGVPIFGGLSSNRGWAWAMGLALKAWKATGTVKILPKWLLPASYFDAVTSANVRYFQANYVENPHVSCSYFGAGPRLDIGDSWMELGYQLPTYALGVTMGRDEFKPLVAYKVGFAQKLIDGVDGWNPDIPAPYEYFIGSGLPGWTLQPDAPAAAKATWFTSMAEVWADFQKRNNFTGPLPDTYTTDYHYYAYAMYPRFGLGASANAGNTDAVRLFAKLDAQMQAKGWPVYFKYSVAPKAAG